MSRTASPGSSTPYGLACVCRVWRTWRATVDRHRSAALVEAIRTVLSGSPFHGEGHRKLWVYY